MWVRDLPAENAFFSATRGSNPIISQILKSPARCIALPRTWPQSLVFSQIAHSGQFRRDGATYFSHCLAVALPLLSSDAESAVVSASLLHDCVEDCPAVSVSVIADLFGGRVAELVSILTKPREGDSFKYLERIAADSDALRIKLFDRLHNMQTAFVYSPRTLELKLAENEFLIARAKQAGLYGPADRLEALSALYQAPSKPRTRVDQLVWKPTPVGPRNSSKGGATNDPLPNLRV